MGLAQAKNAADFMVSHGRQLQEAAMHAAALQRLLPSARDGQIPREMQRDWHGWQQAGAKEMMHM